MGGSAEIIIEPGSAGEETVKEIYRNLQMLYGTVAGELALDRDFGISPLVSDLPQEDARQLLAAEYVAKTERYEPRATVSQVAWTESDPEHGIQMPRVTIELEEGE